MSDGPSAVWSRRLHRAIHLALATALGVALYAPLDGAWIDPLIELVVFPALALSGLLLWRGPRLRRWLADSRAVSDRR